jgi:hypothetical protein
VSSPQTALSCILFQIGEPEYHNLILCLSCICLFLLAETNQENNNAIISPIALQIAVLQSFKPLWLTPVVIPSGNILNLICVVLHVAIDIAAVASEEVVSKFTSTRHLSSSSSTLLISPVWGTLLAATHPPTKLSGLLELKCQSTMVKWS